MLNDLRRLEVLWREKRPDLCRLLRPPVTAERLDDLQSRLGIRLPADFKKLYLWHDGLKDEHAAIEGFFGWCSLTKALAYKRTLDRLEADGRFAEWAPGSWWNLGWVPFLQFNCEDFICVDLPGKLGMGRGAIFIRRNASPDRVVVAPSISVWLRAHVEVSAIGPSSGSEDDWIDHFMSSKAQRTRKLAAPGFPVTLQALPCPGGAT